MLNASQNENEDVRADGLFPLGRLCATRGAMLLIMTTGIGAARLLARHQSGDWGELCVKDRETNDRAVLDGERILSCYAIGTHKLWVITEWDRSTTTFLLPEEY